jgi:hypothetical protein
MTREARKGEASPHAKLTEDDVRRIRQFAAAGATWPNLATLYGVDRSAIRQIVTRRTWRHVD